MPITLSLDEAHEKILRDEAKRQDREMSWIVEKALEQYVERAKK